MLTVFLIKEQIEPYCIHPLVHILLFRYNQRICVSNKVQVEF